MFLRILGESFVRNPRRKLLAGAALMLGIAVTTAMLTVALDVGDRLAAEFRALGANLVVSPQADTLPLAAGDVASEIRGVDRVTDSARDEPGDTLADVEEWGARVRAGLFVAQGTLETERERIVAEANALGTAVLGEDLGGSSVALVRRRVEERLR